MIYKMELADSVDTMVFDLLEVPIVDNDITGIASNTTIDGNVFNDYLWLKKQYVQKWSILCQDEYEQLRGFWTRQFGNAEVPFYRLFYGENDYEERNALTVDGYIQLENPTERLSPLSLTHLYGNATQETLSGKNLAQINDVFQTNQNVNYYRDISMQHRPAFVAGTTYTFSADITIGGSETSCTVSIGAGSTSFLSEVYSRNNQQSGRVVMTFTPTTAQLANGANFFLRFPRFQSVKTGIDYSIKNAMLEVGSTATDFEPYTGGSPMPNPQFPSPVETVTGAQTVKITGKNIINQVETNKTVSSTGTIGAGNTNYLGIESAIACQPSTTYSVSFEHDEPMANIYVGYWDANGDFISRTGYGTDRTFTTPNNAHSFFFYLNKSGITFPTVGGWLQVELSNSPTSYEPYQSQSQEINLGKNLLPTTDGTSSSFGMNYTISSGSISASGTTTATSVCDLTATYPISLKAGQTYTLSMNNPVGGPSVAVRLMDSNNTPLAGSTVNANTGANATISFTPSTDVSGLKGQIRIASGVTVSNFIIKPMLEIGSSATSYAPYKTPIELAKIGTYQDYIWDDDGTWKIHKEVGKVVLDGSENWALYGGGGYAFYYNKSDADFSPSGSSSGAIMSDNLSSEPFSNLYSGATDYGIALTPSPNRRINIRVKGIIYVADIKTWLSTHNTTVYYALATPTDTEITDSELIEQLNHIYSLYQGQNNLWLIPSAGAQGEMEAKYRLIYDEETDIIPQTPVVLTLSDGGVINPCGCRQNVQLTMRETKESSES